MKAKGRVDLDQDAVAAAAAAHVLTIGSRRIEARARALFEARRRAGALPDECFEALIGGAFQAVLVLIQRTVEEFGKPVYKAAAEQAGFTFGMPDSPRKEAIKRMSTLGLVPPA